MSHSTSSMGLSDIHLVYVDQQHRLLPEAKQAFLHMQEAANIDGIDIQICSSYRAFDKQLSIWNRKWRGELPLWTIGGEKLDPAALSANEKIHAIMLWSALPGASRHHWGTDFDVYDESSVQASKQAFMLVPAEYEGEGPCAKMSTWVHKHADEFGFSFPYAKFVGGVAAEPWHLSYINIANKIEAQFNINELSVLLEKSDIEGKFDILKILPELVNRYTFNQGN